MTLDRQLPPAIADIKPFKIIRAVSTKLSNGIPIHYINMGSQPLVKIEIIYNAGNYFESKPGIAFLSTKMLNEGTSQHSSKFISDQIARYGSFLELIPGNDKVIVALTTLTKYLGHLLPLLDEILHDSAFPEQNYDAIRNIYLQNLKVNQEKTSFVATGLFKKNIFGGQHPYGYFLNEKDLMELTVKDCISYYASTIKENNFEIVLSGLVDDTVIQKVDAIFGKRKNKFPQATPIRKESRPEAQTKISNDKSDSVQCSIRIGKRMFTRNHPDYQKFSILNEVLGGYFGSRLMKNIREEKGLTYGIYSQLVSMIGEGYFVIGTDVKKELVHQAKEEIYKEIETLKNTLIPADELLTVKNYMIGSYLGSVNTPFSLADKFKAIHFSQLDYDFYDHYIDVIKKTSAKDLQQLANKYFDQSGFSEIIVG